MSCGNEVKEKSVEKNETRTKVLLFCVGEGSDEWRGRKLYVHYKFATSSLS